MSIFINGRQEKNEMSDIIMSKRGHAIKVSYVT